MYRNLQDSLIIDRAVNESCSLRVRKPSTFSNRRNFARNATVIIVYLRIGHLNGGRIFRNVSDAKYRARSPSSRNYVIKDVSRFIRIHVPGALFFTQRSFCWRIATLLPRTYSRRYIILDIYIYIGSSFGLINRVRRPNNTRTCFFFVLPERCGRTEGGVR